MAICKFTLKGMSNVIDPSNLPISLNGGFVQELASEITNCDTKTPNGVRLRKGYVKVVDSPFHSGWSDGNVAYIIGDSRLYLFNGTSCVELLSLNSNAPASFCKVNDVVVMSNGVDFVILSGSDVYTPPEIRDELQVKTPASTVMAQFAGRLLFAVNKQLGCSNTLSAEVCDRRQMWLDSYTSEVTMIAPVDGGVFVGTTDSIFFYQGVDPYVDGGFTKKKVCDYGAIKGTYVAGVGSDVSHLNLSGKIALFSSNRGICVGSSGGTISNLSEGIVDYSHDNIGCAILRNENGERHYVSSFLRKYSESNVYIQPSFDINESEL